jgi:hypothetical protein
MTSFQTTLARSIDMNDAIVEVRIVSGSILLAIVVTLPNRAEALALAERIEARIRRVTDSFGYRIEHISSPIVSANPPSPSILVSPPPSAPPPQPSPPPSVLQSPSPSPLPTSPPPPPPPRVCTQAPDDANWAFRVTQDQWHSCASSAGRTNDLGTSPHKCANDPASVRIALAPTVGDECLVAAAPHCKIPMREFVSLDYDFAVDSCNGVWAAPLWMTPETWQWEGGSGEIDSLEMCPRDAIHLNFAGGGHQVVSSLSIDRSAGHITVRKDAAGMVTIVACSAEEAARNNQQCQSPTYNGCTDCRRGKNTFACWCNEPHNIYRSGGCVSGTNCTWTLVSDIWNGGSGDAGYRGCMTAVPSIGLNAGTPNRNTNCTLSVERIVLRGNETGGRLRWGDGSSAECAALTVNASPPPAAHSESPPPSPPATLVNSGISTNPNVLQLEVVNNCNYSVWLGGTGGRTGNRRESSCTGERYGWRSDIPGCYFKSFTSDDHSVALTSRTTKTFTIPNDLSESVAWSGNFGFRRGCTGQGQQIRCPLDCCFAKMCESDGSCYVGEGLPPPATLAEITIQNSAQAYYDVSIIGGVNVPISFEPTNAVVLDPANPYRCTNAGGQCSWRMDNVPSAFLETPCEHEHSCVKSLQSSYDQFSTAGNDPTIYNEDVSGQTYRFSLSEMLGCTTYPMADRTGPSAMARSCAGSDRMSPCCGFPDYDSAANVPDGIFIPALGATINTRGSTMWKTARYNNLSVADRVMTLKRICPQAYTFPYDDDYSTFTCGDERTPALNWRLTACPA